MKEKLNREFLDLRKFDCPINAIELIKSITSNPDVEKDPFYIVDLEDICNKHINWITRLPRVEPHYAIKCNTDSMLLKLLAFLGTGFDCASKNEIQKVLDLGVSPDRIIFANPCKQASMIKYAYKQGVNYMTFDNEMELYKIKELHPNARVVLRIMTNDVDAVCRFSLKFGADMETAKKLIATAKRLDLDLAGISFHVGSGQMNPAAFSESIANARTLFDHARTEHGIRMHLLDLGGGYPGTTESNGLFEAIAREINHSLEEHFSVAEFTAINEGMEEQLRVIAEPGRYYACSAFTLAVSVISRRDMVQSEQQQAQDAESLRASDAAPCVVDSGSLANVDHSRSIMYYINDGVYASFNCLFYDHVELHPLLIRDEQTMPAETLYKSSIWGPTCDGLDLVVKECYFPELQLNDFLVFKDMGAYTVSGAVAFNGIPLARCIYVVGASWETIRDAFSADDESVLSMMKEASAAAGTCAAAASLALTRALSVKHDSGADDESAKSEDESTVGLDQSTVDCAITC